LGVTNNIVSWARSKSPWLLHFETGGCNGCAIEILAALMPRYDIERFGAVVKGSPRHADVLLVTGAVTQQIRDRLIRIYEQMPEPKFVVAIGTCACSGGIFNGCYNTYKGADSIIPVNAYIMGCPPKPEAILRGAYVLTQKIRSG